MWTDQEIEILKEFHPVGGYRLCASLLLYKTRGAINSKAMRLGISIPECVRESISKAMGKQNSGNFIDATSRRVHNYTGSSAVYDRTAYKKRTKAKYPEREKARDMVRVAIKKGVLKRLPCMICGDVKSEAHHDDYTKPLEVVFLCRTHHIEADKNRKAQ